MGFFPTNSQMSIQSYIQAGEYQILKLPCQSFHSSHQPNSVLLSQVHKSNLEMTATSEVTECGGV